VVWLLREHSCAADDDRFKRSGAADGAGTLEIPEWRSALAASADALLPSGTLPRWDADSAQYRLPDEFVGAGGAFGVMAAAPLTRERTLGRAEYANFALSGALGCAATHLTVVPLDVVKTRMQTRPGVYRGMADGLAVISRDEGLPMLFQGAGATGIGYFMYGVSVYPGYEFWKRTLFELAGAELLAVARVPLVLAAGAIATIFTCFLITPFESVRIRLVEDPEFAPSLPAAFSRFVDEGDGFATLYDGLIPLMVRQVLFGMIKFLIFDTASDAISAALPPELLDLPPASLAIALASGVIAGVASAICSQPADVLLSRVAQGAKDREAPQGQLPGSVNQLALLMHEAQSVLREFGFGGFFLGLGSRCIWSGAIIGGQFTLYDVFKQLLHVTAAELAQYYDALAATAAFSGAL